VDCKKCHYTGNDEDSKFCIKCGAPLELIDTDSIHHDDTIDYSFPPGRVFEDFQIIVQIGTGGHGDVYKVKELNKEKFWALKILTSVKKKSIPRFQQEFKVLSGLEHKNIIDVYKYGIYGEMHYYIMEIVDGLDLRKFIKTNLDVQDILQGPNDIRRCFLYIMEQICSALDYIHNKNIIHRDIKPSNILITNDDTVKLMDFGLIKAKDLHAQLTATGIILGSASYMSPEQCLGDKVDSSSDLYSLGIILYEIFCGKLPFTANSMIDVISLKSKGELVEPHILNPKIPKPVEKIIIKLLNREQSARYNSAKKFFDDLKKAIPIEEITTSMDRKKSKIIKNIDYASDVTVKRYFDEISSLDDYKKSSQIDKINKFFRKNLFLFLMLCTLTILVVTSSIFVITKYQNKTSEPLPEKIVTTKELIDQNRIDHILIKARTCVAEDKLTSPENENAYNLFQEVLTLDPNNNEAKTGIEDIKNKYFTWIESAMSKKQYDKVLKYLERILSIDPDDEKAKTLQKTVIKKNKRSN
jgi:serine/threonine protein kinase